MSEHNKKEKVKEDYFDLGSTVLRVRKSKKEGFEGEIFVPGVGFGRAKNIWELLHNATSMSKEDFEKYVKKYSPEKDNNR